MTSFYLRLVSAFILFFSLSSAVMIVIGGAQPINPALADFGGCEQPCWLGITPNVTTMEQAQVIAVEYGYSVSILDVNSKTFRLIHPQPGHCDAIVSNNGVPDNIVRAISVANCPNSTLGDLMGIFGTPTGITTCIFNGQHEVSFRFGDSIALRDLSLMSQSEALSPYQNIEIISLFGSDIRESHWLGFVPLWRYYQLTVQRFIYTCF